VKQETIRHSTDATRRCLSDDRGVATLEGIVVYAGLTAVLAGIILLGQWAVQLQNAQMGARLLAFNAGDQSLARFGRPTNQAETAFSRDSVTWSSFSAFDGLPVSWFNTLFTMHNDRRSGSVRGVQSGRLASKQSSSLFEFARATLGYSSGSAAACNAWDGSEAEVRSKFLSISYYVGRTRTHPQGLTSVPLVPSSIALIETVYARVGVTRQAAGN